MGPGENPLEKQLDLLEQTLAKEAARELVIQPAASVSHGLAPLKYRSATKRAILSQLVQNPDATDLQVCRGLDADGGVDLPKNWKGPTGRSFADAYLDKGRRNRIESAISTVRGDLRRSGLLGSRLST